MSRRTRDARGFTVIETMAAITVFALITVGITPLLVSSIRGTALSRTLTVAKNLAQESLERVRGLPYFDVAVNRDVLDLYFPNLATGYNSADQTFTTTCTATSSTPAASGALACPPDHVDGTSRIPAGYTVTYVAQFVTPAGGDPETFSVVTPVSTYDSATAATATQPSGLLRLTVTVTWTELSPRQFRLATMVGDRKLSEEKVRGNASVDHTLQVFTAYQDGLGRVSGLNATGGRSIADIEIRSFASARADTSAAQMVLLRDQFVDADGVTQSGQTLDSGTGAAAVFRAPPSVSPSAVDGASDTINHPDLVLPVGFFASTRVNESATPTPGVQVVNGLPRAATNFVYQGSPFVETFWVHNQPETGETTLKQFDPTKHMVAVFQRSETAPVVRMRGNTYAEATPTSPSSGRKVETKAHAEFGRVVLLPTAYAVGDQGVVVIQDFKSDVRCQSTGDLAGAVADGSWEAVFRYWRDTDPTDGLAVGSYVTVETVAASGKISGSTASGLADPLAALVTENPLVLDDPDPAKRVYLFETRDVNGAIVRNGYFESWDASELLISSKTAIEARVDMPHALSFVTARTDPDNAESSITVGVGKLSCLAVDNRG